MDNTICAHIEAYTLALEEIAKLIERIQTEGINHLSISDFFPSLEMLSRTAFRDWAEDIEDLYGWASPKRQIEHSEVRSRYIRKVYALAAAIGMRDPTNQNARTLSAAIDRLNDEISNAIDHTVCNYFHGKGIPQAREIISDERHGALWDAVENAIISLPATNEVAKVREDLEELKDLRDADRDALDLLLTDKDARDKSLNTPDPENDRRAQIAEAQALYIKRKRKNKRGCVREILALPQWQGRGYNAYRDDGEPLYADNIDALYRQIK